jgi:hypothetical protein
LEAIVTQRWCFKRNNNKKDLGLAPQLGQLKKNALAYFVSALAAKKKNL